MPRSRNPRRLLTVTCTLFTFLFSLFTSICAQSLPPIQWARSTGGPLTDEGLAIVTDAQGNTYAAGFHQQTADIDPGPATLNAPGPGIHIQKLDPAGNLLWAVNYPSTDFFYPHDLALDAHQNLVATGTFTGTIDFDPGTGTANLTASGTHDAFLLKLTPSGTLVFAITALSGTGQNETPKAIALDPQGNITLTGWFDGTVDADPGPGTATLTGLGSHDAFIASYDSMGNHRWAHAFGSGTMDQGWDLTADATGNLTAVGRFAQSIDFDPGPSTTNLTAAGTYDGYILRLTPAGTFISAQSLTNAAASDQCTPKAIATDPSGNLIIAGLFFGTVDLDPGPGTATTVTYGLNDMFLLKLDSTGAYLWSAHPGGGFQDELSTVTTDAAGNIYAAGTWEGTVDLDPGPATANHTAVNLKDFAVSQYTPAGTFTWAAIVGSNNNDFVHRIHVSPQNHLLLTGSYFTTTDFDPSPATYTLTSTSGADAYVCKYGLDIVAQDPMIQPHTTILPNPAHETISITATTPLEEITILNPIGQIIHQINTPETTLTIDITTWPSGIYLLRTPCATHKLLVE
jgi:hypothetical protein